MKLHWNGGIDLGPKEILALLGFVFLAGGGWYKLDRLEIAFDAQAAHVEAMSQDLEVMKTRMSIMETRVDVCCPLFKGEPRRGSFHPNGRSKDAVDLVGDLVACTECQFHSRQQGSQ